MWQTIQQRNKIDKYVIISCEVIFVNSLLMPIIAAIVALETRNDHSVCIFAKFSLREREVVGLIPNTNGVIKRFFFQYSY